MAATPPPLMLDTPAPDFRLPGTDGHTYAFDDIAGENGTVIVFICNHCPYVKAVIDRLVADARALMANGIGFAAICSNDAKAYPADSFEAMQRFAQAHAFPFPLSARRGPVSRADLWRRLHARLLRLQRALPAEIPWSPRRRPHIAATTRRTAGVAGSDACHCRDRRSAARAGAIDRLFHQVEGSRVRGRPRGTPPCPHSRSNLLAPNNW